MKHVEKSSQARVTHVTHQTKLRQARESSGLTVEAICDLVGCTRPTLYRVENGQTTPRQELARQLFKLYRGRVPLAAIYDPLFAEQVRAVA